MRTHHGCLKAMVWVWQAVRPTVTVVSCFSFITYFYKTVHLGSASFTSYKVGSLLGFAILVASVTSSTWGSDGRAPPVHKVSLSKRLNSKWFYMSRPASVVYKCISGMCAWRQCKAFCTEAENCFINAVLLAAVQDPLLFLSCSMCSSLNVQAIKIWILS